MVSNEDAEKSKAEKYDETDKENTATHREVNLHTHHPHNSQLKPTDLHYTSSTGMFYHNYVVYCHNDPYAIYTSNPPYLTTGNLVQWQTPCRTLRSASANLLSVTRCNISFGGRCRPGSVQSLRPGVQMSAQDGS